MSKPAKREIPSVLEMMLLLAADNEDLQNEKNFRDHMTTFVATVIILIKLLYDLINNCVVFRVKTLKVPPLLSL